MSQVLNEATNLSVAPETTLGVQATANFVNLQPNSYGDVGSSVKKTGRMPISKNRQVQKPIVTDLDSKVPFQVDLTKDVIDQFLSGMFMSAVKHSGGTGLSLFRPTAVTGTAYTVASGGALTTTDLIYARGFSIAGNNGLKPVAAAATGTALNAAGLTAETNPPNATVDVVGFQGASADLTLDVNGNLTSTVLDFTTKGLNVGQWIKIGDPLAGAAFAFANAAYVGFARIKAIAAHLITLERRQWTVGAADTGVGKTIRVFYSRWARNVAYNHVDALKPSFTFEITYPDLSAPGTPEYEHPLGNLIDSATLNFPLTDKATVDFNFIGTDTPDPSTVQATGASTALEPLTQLAVNTSTDLMYLIMQNVDETGLTTDFKDLKITFKNNVAPEKVLAKLGAARMNIGRFETAVEMDALFTSDQLVKGVRDNRQCSLTVGARNSDFGFLVDVMAVSLDDENREFPTNASVRIKSKASGFQDPTLGYTAGMSVFGYLPAA